MERKEKVLCRACQTENDLAEPNCRRCGLSLHTGEQGAAGNMVTCPRCLYLNEPGSFFCYKCGKYFVEMEAMPAGQEGQPAGRPAAESTPSATLLMSGGTKISLTGTPTFIERSDFDGTLPDDLLMSISRQHLLITCEKGIYYVEDYGREGRGSTNHTRLNGIDIYKKGKQALKDGDRIELACQPELSLIFKQA